MELALALLGATLGCGGASDGTSGFVGPVRRRVTCRWQDPMHQKQALGGGARSGVLRRATDVESRQAHPMRGAPCCRPVPRRARGYLAETVRPAAKQENSTTDAHRCTRMGQGPRRRRSSSGSVGRLLPLTITPDSGLSACICVHLWLNFLASPRVAHSLGEERLLRTGQNPMHQNGVPA